MTLEEFRTLLDQALAFYNSEHSGAQIDDGVAGGLGAVRYDVAQVLAEAQKEQARKNIGIDELPSGPTEPAISGQFVAIYNVTTSAEIEAAYQAGQTVAILYDNKMGYLIKRSSATDHTFAVVAPYDSDIGGIPINILSCYENRWGRNVIEAENTANKINTITATSDGTQYPSARAVIDYVDNQSKTFEAIFDVTTSEEIEDAYQAGKTITMNNNGVIYYLRERANSQLFVFTTAPFYLDIFQEINIYTATCNNSSWSLATTKAEAVSNKVTIIDANSTNKQYPSAKAVYDYVQNNSGSGADLLNADGIIKQQYFPEGYPYSEVGESIVLPETSVDIDPDNGEGYIIDPFELVVGQTYIVNYNGTNYECVCGTFDLEGISCFSLGNLGAMTGGEDTGEPFIIIGFPDALAAEMGAAGVLYGMDGITPATLSIKGIAEVNTPIAQKFLPKGYPYFVPGGETILAEMMAESETLVATFLNIKPDYYYTVSYNGEKYTCRARSYNIQQGQLMLGNASLLAASFLPDSGEPFVFSKIPDGWFLVTQNNADANVSIMLADSYEKIDSNYLPAEAQGPLMVQLIASALSNGQELSDYEMSHSFSEIYYAFRSGRMVFLEHRVTSESVESEVYTLSEIGNYAARFTNLHHAGGTTFYIQAFYLSVMDDPTYYEIGVTA